MKTNFNFSAKPFQLLFAFAFGMLLFSCKGDLGEVTPVKNTHVISTRDGGLDIKAIHDDYCALICDSVTYWHTHSTLNSGKIATVWNIVKTHMAVTLSVPVDTITARLNSYGITSSNFTNVYSLQSSPKKVYLDSLGHLFLINFDMDDEDLLDVLDNYIDTWTGVGPDGSLDMIKDIAHSSFIYWKHNYSCIQNSRDAAGRTMAKRMAVGDCAGGLFGCFGGPAGALLGAVGGSLGTAIDIAIFG
jgi:hypothetical protein